MKDPRRIDDIEMRFRLAVRKNDRDTALACLRHPKLRPSLSLYNFCHTTVKKVHGDTMEFWPWTLKPYVYRGLSLEVSPEELIAWTLAVMKTALEWTYPRAMVATKLILDARAIAKAWIKGSREFKHPRRRNLINSRRLAIADCQMVFAAWELLDACYMHDQPKTAVSWIEYVERSLGFCASGVQHKHGITEANLLREKAKTMFTRMVLREVDYMAEEA